MTTVDPVDPVQAEITAMRAELAAYQSVVDHQKAATAAREHADQQSVVDCTEFDQRTLSGNDDMALEALVVTTQQELQSALDADALTRAAARFQYAMMLRSEHAARVTGAAARLGRDLSKTSLKMVPPAFTVDLNDLRARRSDLIASAQIAAERDAFDARRQANGAVLPPEITP